MEYFLKKRMVSLVPFSILCICFGHRFLGRNMNETNSRFNVYFVLCTAFFNPSYANCNKSLLKWLRNIYDKQCGPRSDCSYSSAPSGSTLFASILNLSVNLGIYLQQTTSTDDIFRCILRVKNSSQWAQIYEPWHVISNNVSFWQV